MTVRIVDRAYCDNRCGRMARERFVIDGAERYACRRCHMELDGRLEQLRKRNVAGRKPPRPCVHCKRLVTNLRHGRCDTCRVYWNRTGTERPIVDGRTVRRVIPPKLCTVCGKLAKPLRKGICHSCDSSARRGDAIRGFTLAEKGDPWCRLCGATSSLHLHHAIPRGKWKAGRADLRNGIPLCATCHFGWHNKTISVPRTVFRPEEWAFMLTAEIGQSIEFWLDRHYPAEIAAALESTDAWGDS